MYVVTKQSTYGHGILFKKIPILAEILGFESEREFAMILMS
jgi:hypothetical protein